MKNRLLQKGMYAAVFTMAAVQTQAASTVDFSNLVEQVSPAVVSVNVVKKMTQEELLQQQVPELLRRFFWQSGDYSATASTARKNRLRQCLLY